MKKVIFAFEILFVLATFCSLLAPGHLKYFIFYLFLTCLLHVINKFIQPKTPSSNHNSVSPTTQQDLNYCIKPLLTAYEKKFYNYMKEEFNNEYIIIPQVNLAAIIDKPNAKYRNELFRNIDFGIFTKDLELLLLIEIDDQTHSKITRKDRDLKVKKILNDCNITLIKFYSCYPNEKEYVINRIKKYLIKNELNLNEAENKIKIPNN